MYALNANFPDGFLCFVGGKLIFRPNISEKTNMQKFAEVVDTETLKVGGGYIKPQKDEGVILVEMSLLFPPYTVHSSKS